VTPEKFRSALDEAVVMPGRFRADLLAALGSDGAPVAIKEKKVDGTSGKRGKGKATEAVVIRYALPTRRGA
jgi:hypothetical protein